MRFPFRMGILVWGFAVLPAAEAGTLPSLYAHRTVEDAHGVIAPWYGGLNGQLDERATLAVNVYKRYPWVTTNQAVLAAPDFVYNSHWRIQPDGTIVIPPTTDWMCGDLSQRAWSIIKGLTAYYQYSGDPIAFVYIPLTADYILDYAQTPADDPAWPTFPISTPTLGKAYGRCDPRGRNQLDLCAVVGTEILRAHKLTGNPRYLEAARHWGDLFATHCNFNPTESPWDRYVDPSVVGWSDVLTAAPTFLRHAALSGDAWAQEIGRRMILMATYDSDEHGVVKDGLFGDAVATGEWSNLAHPWPLCQVMEALAWVPRDLAPNRENHLLRSSSVVQEIRYEPGRLHYRTFDAPVPAIDLLRLAFEPGSVTAEGLPLRRRAHLDADGYTAEPLPNGDCLVTIRHDGKRHLLVEGQDPQETLSSAQLRYTGEWTTADGIRSASSAGATLTATFHGNQVYLVGTVDTDGGWADAYVDGVKQITRVECWNPQARSGQLLFAKKGLPQGPHELKVVVRGEKNPLARGTRISVERVSWSAAAGNAGFGSGGGPTGPQRMIFGYPKREDYLDSQGHAWRPATEFVIRLGACQDTVARSWWTSRRTKWVGNTPDPELYRYGVHGKEFKVNLTVGPGRYRVTLKWADTAETPWMERENGWNRVTRPTAVWINGEPVLERMDVPKEAGGLFRAVDRTFGPIAPRNGLIEIRFQGVDGHEAMIQALELVPAEG